MAAPSGAVFFWAPLAIRLTALGVFGLQLRRSVQLPARINLPALQFLKQALLKIFTCEANEVPLIKCVTDDEKLEWFGMREPNLASVRPTL